MIIIQNRLQERLELLRIADAVLDPTPIGGVVPMLEALAMGTPVVTLAGGGTGERRSFVANVLRLPTRPLVILPISPMPGLARLTHGVGIGVVIRDGVGAGCRNRGGRGVGDLLALRRHVLQDLQRQEGLVDEVTEPMRDKRRCGGSHSDGEKRKNEKGKKVTWVRKVSGVRKLSG